MKSFNEILRSRQTKKYIANTDLSFQYDNEIIETLIENAWSAPFHYPAQQQHISESMDAIQPWRIYALNQQTCRDLRDKLVAYGDKTKIPQLLAAASHLLLVTWLPDKKKQTDSEPCLFEPTLRNMEHIAATSSAIENILLSCAAENIPNYWSSGGVLTKTEILSWFSIPNDQILLGAIFLFPPEEKMTDKEKELTTIVDGKMREQKTPWQQCRQWVDLE